MLTISLSQPLFLINSADSVPAPSSASAAKSLITLTCRISLFSSFILRNHPIAHLICCINNRMKHPHSPPSSETSSGSI
ncbi:MAG: hypothetical protein ACTSV5_10950 [Promethearchaeota archaeon]